MQPAAVRALDARFGIGDIQAAVFGGADLGVRLILVIVHAVLVLSAGGQDGGAQGDALHGIDGGPNLLGAELLYQQGADQREGGGAAHQQHVVDVGRGEVGHGEGAVHQHHAVFDVLADAAFELGLGDGDVDVDTSLHLAPHHDIGGVRLVEVLFSGFGLLL